MANRPTTTEHEELFDAFRQVVSDRTELASAGDDLWNALEDCRNWWESFENAPLIEDHIARWEKLRGIGGEPPVEPWRDLLTDHIGPTSDTPENPPQGQDSEAK